MYVINGGREVSWTCLLQLHVTPHSAALNPAVKGADAGLCSLYWLSQERLGLLELTDRERKPLFPRSHGERLPRGLCLCVFSSILAKL